MLKIRFLDGRVESVALEAPGCTLGKGAVNDVVIDADGVNGFHADLKVDGADVTLTDVNSATGTYLNGELVEASSPVEAGDIIIVQGVELEVFEESSASKALVLSGTALMDLGTGGWSLVADSGPERGQVIPVKEMIVIGRALECDISILEPGLSRRHAELTPIGDELLLKDMGASNGTLVNGEKVDEVSLADGDVMQFHKVRSSSLTQLATSHVPNYRAVAQGTHGSILLILLISLSFHERMVRAVAAVRGGRMQASTLCAT